jgi:hypothetical protein
MSVQARKSARVIDVRVGQHHHVDVFGAHAQLAVAFDGVRAAPLKEAAVEQDARVLGMYDVP